MLSNTASSMMALMHLSPQERDKLLVHVAADVARSRKARGLRMNYPEAVALITDHVLEGARDGRSVGELMSSGREVLSKADVLDGVGEMLDSRAGRGHVPGRHQARHRPQPDRLTWRAEQRRADPARSSPAKGPSRSTRAGTGPPSSSRTPRTGPCRSARTTTSRPSTPGSTFDRAAAWGTAPRHPGRHVGALRAGRRARGGAGPVRPGRGSSAACASSTPARWTSARPNPAR